MSPLTTTIPIFSVQPTFLDVIADVKSGVIPKDKFWIYGLLKNKTLDGLIDVYRSGSDVILRGLDGFEVQGATDRSSIKISCPELRAQDVLVRTPKYSIKTATPIETFDISPQAELYVTGGPNGEVTVSSLTDNGAFTRSLEGHLAYITKVLFFPSGQVVLSAGGDMQIKLWSATDGSNPRTFRGHKRPITDLATIARGRNFLSASRDGTVKLWECGTGDLVHTFTNPTNMALEPTAIAVSKRFDQISVSPSSSLEFETDDKLVTIGYENGDIALYGVSSKDVLATIPTRSIGRSVLCLEVMNDTIFAAREDSVEIWDARSLTVPLETIELPSPVTAISAISPTSVALATKIGMPLVLENGTVSYYAAGFEDGVVAAIDYRGSDGLFVAGKDGVIKRF